MGSASPGFPGCPGTPGHTTQLAAWLPTASVPGCLFAVVGFQKWGLVGFKTLPLPPESLLHIPLSLMYMEKEPLPSAKPKLGQVGKKSGSFPSWLPTPGTENVPGFLTTGESKRKRHETGADVSRVKCLSVQQHLPPGILPPWVGGALCSSHLPPLNSPKQVQKRRAQASCCHPELLAWLLAKVGKGER